MLVVLRIELRNDFNSMLFGDTKDCREQHSQNSMAMAAYKYPCCDCDEEYAKLLGKILKSLSRRHSQLVRGQDTKSSGNRSGKVIRKSSRMPSVKSASTRARAFGHTLIT